MNVYSADEFSQLKVINGICVVNNDISTQPGQHWLCIYMNKNTIELFDSSGKMLFPKIFLKKFLDNNVNKNIKIKFNNQMIQNPDSNLCGQYCCLFALAKAKKKSFEAFLKMFDKNNSIKNDKLVVKLFKNNFMNLHTNCLQVCSNLQDCIIKK